MIKYLNKKHNDCPLYLLGESLGGIIVLNIALNYQMDVTFQAFTELKEKQKNITGLILVAPGIEPKMNLNILEMLKFMVQIPVSLVFKNLKLINLENNWENANKDPEQLKKMREDPLLLRNLSIAFLVSIAKYHKRVMKKCIDLELPVLILQGKADDVVSYKGAEKFYDKLKSKDKKIKLLENASHGLMADEATPEVIRSIEEWLKSNR